MFSNVKTVKVLSTYCVNHVDDQLLPREAKKNMSTFSSKDIYFLSETIMIKMILRY